MSSFNPLIDEVEKAIKMSSVVDDFTGLYKPQREALINILSKLKEQDKISGILQMPTGSGKTLLIPALMVALHNEGLLLKWIKERLIPALMVALHNEALLLKWIEGVVLLFLAPRDVLRQQTYDKVKAIIESTLGIPVKKLEPVGWPSRDEYSKLIEETRGVVITTPQLLHSIYKRRRDFTRFYKKLFSPIIVILDEAHTYYIGENVKKTIDQLVRDSGAKLVLGLTATPISDSKKLLGDLLYYYSSFSAMSDGVLIPRLRIVRYSTHVEGLKPEEGIKPNIYGEQDEWKFAVYERAEEYASKILDEMEKLMRDVGRLPKVLVASVNTTEADLISEHLKKTAKERELPLEVLRAHYKEKEARDTIEEFREQVDPAILVTVNMVDIGFDDPNLDVLVIARPLKSPVSYIQVRGRVLRKPKSETSVKKRLGYATIIDLVGEATKHEKIDIIERVERGEYDKKSFKMAKEELRGQDEVSKAHAEVVRVADREELIIPSKSSTPSTMESINYIKMSFSSYETLNMILYVKDRGGLIIKITPSDNLEDIIRDHGLYLEKKEVEELRKRIEELFKIAEAFRAIVCGQCEVVVPISEGKLEFKRPKWPSPHSPTIIVFLQSKSTFKIIYRFSFNAKVDNEMPLMYHWVYYPIEHLNKIIEKLGKTAFPQKEETILKDEPSKV